MSRLHSVRLALLAIAAGVLSIIGTAAARPQTPAPVPGFGRCHASHCSCFRFQGSGYTCTRGGCGHHYDRHY